MKEEFFYAHFCIYINSKSLKGGFFWFPKGEMMNYENLMRECFDLALKGRGKVLTNPMVGAIVFKNGKIIGRGYHKSFHQDHAEIDCFNNLEEAAEGGTLVVNLEPCSHFGKHPPCVDEVIRRKIKKVVISNLDTNPKVDGIKKLKDAGIEVITGVLENEGKKLNEKFFFNMKYKRPLVALKYAQSLDGKIATETFDSKWISNEESRAFVHELRNDYDAILVGANTLASDNPKLTSRIDGGVNPYRIIVTSSLSLDPLSEVFLENSDNKTIIATNSTKDFDINAEIIRCKTKGGGVDLEDLLDKLYKRDVGSVLVEGGSVINNAFLKENLVDKIYQFMAPIIVSGLRSRSAFMGEGAKLISEAKKFRIDEIRRFGSDVMFEVNDVYRDC